MAEIGDGHAPLSVLAACGAPFADSIATMSTDIYRVHVERIVKDQITLKLVIRNAESGNLPEGKPWALMLLCEAEQSGLTKQITASQRIDEAFLLDNCDRFIAIVKLVDKKNYPIADERAYDENEYADNPKKAAWGRYTITVADAALLKGLKVTASWDSASYAPQPRKPVAAKPAKAKAKPITGNFIEALLATETAALDEFELEGDAAEVVRALRAKPPIAELDRLLEHADPAVRTKTLIALRQVGKPAKALAPKILRSARSSRRRLGSSSCSSRART